MIDPIVSLAFSLQANKGAYALLIGSGVSRSAGIPTGWEITLELVRKIAAASGAEISSTAEDWFHETYNKGPDYSELLDQLCKTAAERQQYLKGFFEPSDQEREDPGEQSRDRHRPRTRRSQGKLRIQDGQAGPVRPHGPEDPP